MSNQETIARLNDPRPPVRRIAIMDLLRDGDPESLHALCSHMPREREERCSLTLMRGLATCTYEPARDALARRRDDVQTPIAIYHAAVLAHDALEVATRPAPPTDIFDPEDAEPEEE